MVQSFTAADDIPNRHNNSEKQCHGIYPSRPYDRYRGRSALPSDTLHTRSLAAKSWPDTDVPDTHEFLLTAVDRIQANDECFYHGHRAPIWSIQNIEQGGVFRYRLNSISGAEYLFPLRNRSPLCRDVISATRGPLGKWLEVVLIRSFGWTKTKYKVQPEVGWNPRTFTTQTYSRRLCQMS